MDVARDTFLARAARVAMAFLARTDPSSVRMGRAVMGALLFVTFGVLGVLAFVNAVEDSPLVPSFRARANITTMLPEGWAFFTRDPREPQWILFSRGRQGWQPLEQRHASSPNHYGFGRHAPLQMMELSAVVSQAPDSAWLQFPADTDPLILHTMAVPVRNPALRPVLCADLLVVEREPVPWAWSAMAASVRMAGRLLHLSIECGAGFDQQNSSETEVSRGAPRALGGGS